MSDYLLTTIDNPWNPFDQFYEWLRYDEVEMRYCTLPYLARVTKITDDMTEEEEDEETIRAMDEICHYNPLRIYRKVTRDDYKNGKWHPKSFKSVFEAPQRSKNAENTPLGEG